MGDSRRDKIKQELDDLLRFVFEENLEVLDDHFARTVALNADGEDVLFDLRHWRLSHQLLILPAKHALHLVLELRILLQILANAHQLLWLL